MTPPSLPAETLLEIAAVRARDGLLNPLTVLTSIAGVYPDGDHRRAFRLAMDAAGGTLTAWFDVNPPRTPDESAQLFVDALAVSRIKRRRAESRKSALDGAPA
jgi:hypothetical protein